MCGLIGAQCFGKVRRGSSICGGEEGRGREGRDKEGRGGRNRMVDGEREEGRVE